MSSKSGLVQTKDLPSRLSPEQITFNKLKKKIETLQGAKKKRIQDLNQCLAFYFENIVPEQKAMQSALEERIHITYEFYKAKKYFRGEERKAFKEFILDDVREFCEMKAFMDVSDSMRQIFEELGGVDFEKAASEEFGGVKDEMEEMFRENGMDVDLSEVDFSKGPEGAFEKIFESMADVFEQQEPSEKPKTKKQLEKEEKQRQLEDMQKNGIRTVYKQLAKAFHPDLEYDNEQKSQKVELMKRLTNAYEENDLYELLALELEWIDGSSQRSHSSEQLKVYNDILKDQVKEIQQSTDMLVLEPEYISIQRYFNCDGPFRGISALHTARKGLRQAACELKNLIKGLRGTEAEYILREALYGRAIYY